MARRVGKDRVVQIGAWLATCEDDALRWGEQWLAEATRLQIQFTVYFDKCSQAVVDMFRTNDLFLGGINGSKPFDELCKDEALQLLRSRSNADWLMTWDTDETWEPEAPQKLKLLEPLDCDEVRISWVNLWNDSDVVLVNYPSNPVRSKLFTGKRAWKYAHGCVATPGLLPPQPGKEESIDLVCLHHGLMTRELREMQKQRWDKIYGRVMGRNPYGAWDWVLNEKDHPPLTMPLDEFLKTGRYSYPVCTWTS